MNQLTGKLEVINLIKGSLTPTEMNLVGVLSVSNNILTGTLTSAALPVLTGQLVSIENNNSFLSGNITIPPEVPVPNYQGEYIITPKPFNDKVLQTNGFKMKNDLIILKIPYYQTSNETGYTIYIGGE